MIDKDGASSLLARELGARRLVILTDVPAVVRGFGREDAAEVRTLSPAEAEALLPTLAAGSMKPKVAALLEFALATGGEALITSPAALAEALAREAGTHVEG